MQHVLLLLQDISRHPLDLGCEVRNGQLCAVQYALSSAAVLP
jgi:hypothetical protein